MAINPADCEPDRWYLVKGRGDVEAQPARRRAHIGQWEFPWRAGMFRDEHVTVLSELVRKDEADAELAKSDALLGVMARERDKAQEQADRYWGHMNVLAAPFDPSDPAHLERLADQLEALNASNPGGVPHHPECEWSPSGMRRCVADLRAQASRDVQRDKRIERAARVWHDRKGCATWAEIAESTRNIYLDRAAALDDAGLLRDEDEGGERDV